MISASIRSLSILDIEYQRRRLRTYTPMTGPLVEICASSPANIATSVSCVLVIHTQGFLSRIQILLQ